jgi:hypothetical protein
MKRFVLMMASVAVLSGAAGTAIAMLTPKVLDHSITLICRPTELGC